MLSFTAHFSLLSPKFLIVQSSMGLTQPTWTCHSLLCRMTQAQQETLWVWYWGSDWTLQLCTITLYLQLEEMSLWQCEGSSQLQNIVCIYMLCVSCTNCRLTLRKVYNCRQLFTLCLLWSACKKVIQLPLWYQMGGVIVLDTVISYIRSNWFVIRISFS